MKVKIKNIIAIFLAVFLLLGLAACKAENQSIPTSTTVASTTEFTVAPTTEQTVATTKSAPTEDPIIQSMDIAVYYLKDNGTDMYLVREVHTLPKNKEVAHAALNELILGTPIADGVFKVLPEDTKILGIDITDGLVTVDFSKEVLNANIGSTGETLGITSIVNTLTEFPTIQKVQFTVEGSAEKGMDWWGHVGLYEQPFERNLSMVYEPAIWVTHPTTGQTITSPITIKGNARVFEATVSYRLEDNSGNILAEGYTTATAGAPDRGEYTSTFTFTPGTSKSGQLEVFEVSMKDGSEVNKVTVPLVW